MKKEEIFLGAELIFQGSDEDNTKSFNGTELVVIGKCFPTDYKDKNTFRVRCRITKLSNDISYKIGQEIQPVIDCLVLGKPHEYSPINLTMYYRTIGD